LFRFVWYYEGRNGWWQYDDRTCAEIETAFANKTKLIDVLVAGSVYVIDLENQVQYQRHRQSRKRKIKRDVETANKKGIAGLQMKSRETAAVPQPSSSSNMGASSNAQQPTNVPNYSDDNSQTDRTVELDEEQDVARQLPIGADLQSINSLGISNPLFNVAPPPDLIRAVSDTTNTNRQNQPPPDLFRFNTYSHSEQTQDTPME